MVKTQSTKGIYLIPQVQYELKKVACTHHIQLKQLVPAILWYISTHKNRKYATSLISSAEQRKQVHITLADMTYDRLKIQACEHHLPFNMFLNVAILSVIDEPYQSDTDEELVATYYRNIVSNYQSATTDC